MNLAPPLATLLGAQGFIGSALRVRLEGLGWECRITGRDTPWPILDQPLGHVFYCAGLTADYAQRPFDTVEAHVCLLNRVLRSADYQSLVYLSSTRLYDGRLGPEAGNVPGPFGLAPENPRHLYDLTKLTGEAICRAAGRGRARTARLSCVYRDATDKDGFLGQLMRRVRQSRPGEVIELDSSPAFTRDYVHIDDVVDALIAIAVRGSQPVYNVACGGNYSNAELAALIARVSGRRILFLRDTTHGGAPVVDISLLREELGLAPAAPEEKIVQSLA